VDRCATICRVPKQPEQKDPHVLDPDHHPTPFTAAEIREGSPLGRTVRQRIEEAGSADALLVQQYVAVDEESGTRLVYALESDGTRRDVRRSRSTWLELQGHASMPRSTTTIEAVTIETPMGPLDCLLYTAVDGEEVARFWFARAIPGMPVRTERRVGGVLVDRVTMLSSGIEPLQDDADGPRASG
jgi:hypothetical protein